MSIVRIWEPQRLHFGSISSQKKPPEAAYQRSTGIRLCKMSVFSDFRHESIVPFGRLLGHLFGTFYFSSLRDTKKGCPGGPSKLDPCLGRFWGLPGGPQEGSRLDGSSIFTFAAGPKKGSKMEPKMEPFGLPNPNYAHFGLPFGRNRGPKSCIKK